MVLYLTRRKFCSSCNWRALACALPPSQSQSSLDRDKNVVLGESKTTNTNCNICDTQVTQRSPCDTHLDEVAERVLLVFVAQLGTRDRIQDEIFGYQDVAILAHALDVCAKHCHITNCTCDSRTAMKWLTRRQGGLDLDLEVRLPAVHAADVPARHAVGFLDRNRRHADWTQHRTTRVRLFILLKNERLPQKGYSDIVLMPVLTCMSTWVAIFESFNNFCESRWCWAMIFCISQLCVCSRAFANEGGIFVALQTDSTLSFKSRSTSST